MEEFSLPPEILSMIFQYLPASDVKSCSLVCLSWREETNRNELWRSLCIQNKLIEEWEDPDETSIMKQVEGSRLSPLSPWHATFNRCAHQYEKMKSGNYVIQKFDEDTIKKHHVTPLITATDVDGENIALGDVNGNVTIWKLKKQKAEFLESVLCAFKDAEVDEIFLSLRSFAVIQLGILQVFCKNDKNKYFLSYYKAMIEDPRLSSLTPYSDAGTVANWFYDNIFEYPLNTDWDLESLIVIWGPKIPIATLSLNSVEGVKTLQLPFQCYQICDVAVRLDDSDKIYVAIKHNDVGDVILVNSLQQGKCIEQMAETSTIQSISVNHKILVSLNEQGFITVWNCLKGGKNHLLLPSPLTCLDRRLNLHTDSIIYQSENKIVYLSYNSGRIQIKDSYEADQSGKFFLKAIGSVHFLQVGDDLEVVDKSWKHRVNGILDAREDYDVWGCDEYIVFKDYHRPPIILWF